MSICLERVACLVKLVQRCSKINQQYPFWKKIPSMCAFLGVKWCKVVALVILPKTFLQNFFLKLQAKMYLVNQFEGFFFNFLIFWKLFDNPCLSWLVILISSQCYFEIESTQLIFYAKSLVELYMNMILFSYFLRNYFQSTSR